MAKTLLRISSRLFGIFLILLLMSISVSGHDKIIKPRNWLCYYGTTFGPEIYSKFDMVVLDGYNHPPLEKTYQNYPILLGYLSIGEVDVDGPFWKLAKDKSYLVRKNEFWDSWIIDIRSPDWQQLIFKTAIPYILSQGFDGLFLDTLDSSLSLVEGNEGIENALQGIIRKIKQNYPDKIITVNRGLPVLSKIAKYIDFILIEDLYSYYAGDKKGYIKVDTEAQKMLLHYAEEGLKVNPNLGILTLDYAANDQIDLALEAISYSRKKGFIPYVSTYELDQIFFYTLGN